MTGPDFLPLAARLASSATEAEWRTAVSRAYYAAFHAVRELFRALGFQVPQADRAHAYLAFRLQNCGHPTLQQAGVELNELRQFRNMADYDLTRPYAQRKARGDVALAQRILQALAVTSVEPTRTQVRDAIINYERIAYGQITWKP